MRVGTSITTGLRLMLTEDHPHACGDKPYHSHKAESVLGSSPRVWGQGKTNGKSFKWLGIIPTRVGTSVCCCVFTTVS